MGRIEKYMPRCRIFLLDGKKFRTNLLVLFFEIPLRRETATKTALLAELLKRGCEPYPTPRTLAQRTEEMYGALWDVSVVKKGDKALLLFSLETLKAVDVEEATNFLRALALRPLTENGAFPEQVVKRQKAILRQKLKALQDDKREFARKRALEETAEGTPWAISADGYEEDLEHIDGKQLYGYYQEILQRAKVMIFFCGEREEKNKILALRREFPGRVAMKEQEEPDFERGAAPRFVSEEAEVEQTRILLGFEAENGGNPAAQMLLNRILGGDADSLLFQKVREEKGLCYDIKSFRYPLAPWLFVQAGIRQKDGKDTAKMVMKCVESLQKEPISSKRLQQAKESIRREYEGMEDQPWAMVDFFAEQALQQKELSTERFLRRLERVDAEALSRGAARLKLRVVYMLSEEKEESHA